MVAAAAVLAVLGPAGADQPGVAAVPTMPADSEVGAGPTDPAVPAGPAVAEQPSTGAAGSAVRAGLKG
ncbi:Uncharacterised protein [Mycobacterium tuberculosis]|nr:Uncharacterised protein [Mycobacterium tuberculosis]